MGKWEIPGNLKYSMNTKSGYGWPSDNKNVQKQKQISRFGEHTPQSIIVIMSAGHSEINLLTIMSILLAEYYQSGTRTGWLYDFAVCSY
jgi:hypothetical protein